MGSLFFQKMLKMKLKLLKCPPLINSERWTSDPLVTDLLNFFSAKPVVLASCAIFPFLCAEEHPLQQTRDGHSH